MLVALYASPPITVLYSGHHDGALTKWSLDSNEEIWSKSIYADGIEDFGEVATSIGIFVRETPGFAGIVVRPDPVPKANQSIVHLD